MVILLNLLAVRMALPKLEAIQEMIPMPAVETVTTAMLMTAKPADQAMETIPKRTIKHPEVETEMMIIMMMKMMASQIQILAQIAAVKNQIRNPIKILRQD